MPERSSGRRAPDRTCDSSPGAGRCGIRRALGDARAMRAGASPDGSADGLAAAAVDAVAEVRALFDAVAGIGPFFTVATGPEPAGGGWVPLRAVGEGALIARIRA